ncbi:hypothetical protein J2X11_001506 [Aeromicrobium panaciterrae]|uniref:DUF6318 domain-containing protein n=1 Tax=Aeromicrobium panaciterrae TaxID=363861 RepID=A0ABU1UNA7_9ACTN|nr:DUF6318 family protein [Aeromicrobium panaciterrae]MDR7086667.1 hypothetical protein [Aeromicrobium panaciterrae]
MLRLAVATSLLILVAGCTDPEPKEPKPTTSATPTATAPTMPAQAKENTPEGASAFVAHYIDVFNYAANTGDVAELSRLSSPKCSGCENYIQLYRDTYENGGFFKGSDWKLGELEVTFDDGKALVFATVKSEPGTYAESSSATPQPGNPEDSDLTFVLIKKSQAWTLETLELQAAS